MLFTANSNDFQSTVFLTYGFLIHSILSFTIGFGPPPYLPTVPFTNKPVADQFEINCYIKEILNERYALHPR